ncbi:hypothetical protein KCU71_g379, partial [Aureobasidium melanogenum]
MALVVPEPEDWSTTTRRKRVHATTTTKCACSWAPCGSLTSSVSYGVANENTDLSITPPNEIGDAVGASWMASDAETNLTELKEPPTVAGVEENDISQGSHEDSAVDNAGSGSDLILFT